MRISAVLKENIKTKSPIIYSSLVSLKQKYIDLKRSVYCYATFKKAIFLNVPFFGIPGGLATGVIVKCGVWSCDQAAFL